jgi:hypothetical protein
MGVRDLFTTGPGPDTGDSNPRDGCAQMPEEKSGIDAALCVALPAGPAGGTTDCPQAGVAAAPANVTAKRKSRRCKFMLPSLS